MGKLPPRPGYIAIARTIFDHPLLKTKKPFSRTEAWEWLINEAAWTERGNRNKFGSIHTDRGQLCITRRDLAQAWRWPRSNVDRFLKRLASETMILLGVARNGPKTNPETEAIHGYPRTMISICNYNKFQPGWRGTGNEMNQQPNQKAGQNIPTLPGIIEEVEAQTSKQQKTESSAGAAEIRRRTKPHHGARGNGMVWFDHGTMEWTAHANQWREARGTEKLPESRIGGRGNWFRWLGERKHG
jgi:hypothetical protein